MFATAVAYSLGQDRRHPPRVAHLRHPFFLAPGRMNVFNEHPFKVIMDYGHNPAAVRAMCELAERTQVRGRRTGALAMPGDRRDEDIAEVAKHRRRRQFDHYRPKRDDNPRGRKPDEVPKHPAAGAARARACRQTRSAHPGRAGGRAGGARDGRAQGDLVLVFADNVARGWKQIAYFDAVGSDRPTAPGRGDGRFGRTSWTARDFGRWPGCP